MPATFTVTELFGGRRAGGDLKDHTYARRFFVEASEQATPVEVVAADGIPIFGSAYTAPNGFVDNNSFAKTINATARDEHPLFFDVEVEYSNTLDFAPGQGINPTAPNSPQPGAGDPLKSELSPLLKPWVIRWGTGTVTKAILEDYAGEAIVNAAGAPFEGGLEVETGFLTLTVTRNELAALFDPIAMNALVWHTNQAPWNLFDPGQVLLVSVETGDRAYDRGVYYFPVTYQFRIANAGKTWDRRVLEAGWYYRSEGGIGDRKPFLDAFGQPVATPGLLTQFGDKLALDGTPVYRTFQVYPRANFSSGLRMD